MHNTDKKRVLIGYGMGILATLLWAPPAVLVRYMVADGVDAFTIAGLRLYIGALTLAFIIFIGVSVKKIKVTKPKYTLAFWMAGIGLGLNYLLFHKGLQFTIASNAVLLEAFAPVVVLILTILIFPSKISHLIRDLKVFQKVIMIVIAGSIGASLLLINEPQDILMNLQNKLTGDLIEFIAMVLFAIFLLGSHEYRRTNMKTNSLVNTARFLFLAALVLTPFMKWGSLVSFSQTQWMWIAALGIFSTSLSYTLWHHASKYLDVVPIAILFSLTSVFAVALEAIVFELELSPKLLLGAMLIIGASISAEMINAKYKVIDRKREGGT